MRGCNGGARAPAILIGEAHETCPLRLVKDEPGDFGRAVQLYSLYQNGVMLQDGALLEQPNPYIELMYVIACAAAEIEKFYNDKSQREAEAAKRKR